MLLAKKKEGKWETKAYFKHIKCTKSLREKTKQKNMHYLNPLRYDKLCTEIQRIKELNYWFYN
jgi:hypothetical protein